jgi:CRISPR-associated protein Cst2
MKSAKALTLTYLTPVSFASLNGSDKEADNMSNIKKISVGVEQYPYVSSQAIRRALRNQLEVLGRNLSEGVAASQAKGAATTLQEPENYIDDDLFGYMGTESGDGTTKGKSTKRTSVVRVSPLIALNPYQGDLDFGTNYMGVKAGGDPNIFETEIHSGLYRGTILVELDRVGSGDGFKQDIDNLEKAARVKDLIKAIKNLWASGRQSRFLADIAPKFVVAAMLSTKNPIFLESVKLGENGIDIPIIEETLDDYKSETISSTIGMRKGFFVNEITNAKSLGEAFEEIEKWIDEYYQQ